MSVSRQPEPRRAPDAAGWLRWALAATMSALLIVLVLLAAALLALRREMRPPAAPRKVSTRAPAGEAAISAHVGQRRPAASHAAFARHLARRPPDRRQDRPLVQIVERSVVVPPAAPTARPAGLPRLRVSAPSPERVLGARWTMPAPDRALPGPDGPPPSAPPPAANLSVPGDGLESPPEPIAQPPAVYPESAAAEGVTGSARVKLVVDQRGRVEDAVVVRSSGDDRLDLAAETAVHHWRYRPAQREGRAVTAVDYVVVNFYREQDRSVSRE